VKQSLTIRIAWGGSTYPWKSAPVLACIIIGFLALVSFALYGIYTPSGIVLPHAQDDYRDIRSFGTTNDANQTPKKQELCCRLL
jgi:hypothetical protein